eukprot:246312-Prymnesium_polylepis.1
MRKYGRACKGQPHGRCKRQASRREARRSGATQCDAQPRGAHGRGADHTRSDGDPTVSERRSLESERSMTGGSEDGVGGEDQTAAPMSKGSEPKEAETVNDLTLSHREKE